MNEKRVRVIAKSGELGLDESKILAEVKRALLTPLPFGSRKFEVVYHSNHICRLITATERSFSLENSPGN